MKFDAYGRSETHGTVICVEATGAQEALQKAQQEIGAEYPVIEIRDHIDYQSMPQHSGYQGCLMSMPPVLAESTVGNPRNPYFPHLPL